MDASSRRRRVRSYLLQAALWAPTDGEKDSRLEALLEQQDWDDALADRWPGLDATELNNDHQISPTQPMKDESKQLRPTSARQ